MKLIDAISYILVITILGVGYRIYKERIKGKKIGELKGACALLIISMALLWVINIYNGFIQ